MWQRAYAPAPSGPVAVGTGGSPVLVETSPMLVRVKTVAVKSWGAPEMMVAVPLTVVRTGVTVSTWPESATVTHMSVGFAAVLATLVAAEIAVTAPRSSHADAVYLVVCMMKREADCGATVPQLTLETADNCLKMSAEP